jgi:hypothetical protein
MIWAGKKGIKVKGFTYNTSVIFADFPEPGITDLMYLANAIDFAMDAIILYVVYMFPLYFIPFDLGHPRLGQVILKDNVASGTKNKF